MRYSIRNGCRSAHALRMGAMVWLLSPTLALATATTTTSLTLSSSTVVLGTVVTLTAAVTNGSPVTVGTITFCDATAKFCEDAAVLGTAQLTPAGVAVIRFVPGNGIHSYKAIFSGTAANGKSTSTAQPVTVTGTNGTVTTLSSAGTVGNYTLTAAVAATGSGTLSTASNVSFVDNTIGYTFASTASGVTTPVYTFSTKTLAATGTTPKLTVTGDFNSDGHPDIAVVNSAANTVSVLLGNGDGSFRSQVSYAVGLTPSSLAVADFNEDGKPDLVVTNYASNTVSILLGNGDGSFKAQATFAVGRQPQSVAIADFNSDGHLDMAVENKQDNTLSVLLGAGSGSFSNQIVVSTQNTPYALVLGDFNADGKADVAIVNSPNPTVSVLLGNGSGGISAQYNYTVGVNPQALAMGDFNGDGKVDLAVVNNGSASLSILLGTGTGTFGAAVSYAVGNNPNSLAVGDVNGDGKDDLIVTNFTDGTLSVLLGNGDGTFKAQVVYVVGTNPAGVAIVDFNGDGNGDVVTSNSGDNDVTVWLTTIGQKVSFTKSGLSTPGTGTHTVDAVFAGDGTFNASTSNVISLTATPANTSLALTPSTSSGGPYGQSVTLTATLTPAQAGSLTTNGELISFKNGSTTIGTGILTNGTATITLAAPPVGTENLTVVYAGDTNFLASTSPVLVFTVIRATPVLSWAAPSTIVFGSALGATQLNAISVTVPGTFVYTPSAGTILAAGTSSLSATFTPTDPTDYTTATISTSITVIQSATSIALAGPGNSVGYGSQVTFTAGLSFAATGLITFLDGTAILGSGSIAAGTAIFSTSALSVGSHSITALWPGDSNHMAATSAPVTQIITRAAVRLIVQSSLNPSVYGDSVSFSIQIAGGGVAPTGKAVLSEGATTLATVTLNASGLAVYSTPGLLAGVHLLSVRYLGDGNYF